MTNRTDTSHRSASPSRKGSPAKFRTGIVGAVYLGAIVLAMAAWLAFLIWGAWLLITKI